MDRCAILVDAGYLLGAAGTLIARDSDRSALDVDHSELVQALIEEATAQTGLVVLRVLWYDGAFNGQPTPEHRTLRVLPDVKVRLGEMVVRSGRVQQKGVDSYLQRDLITLARNHAVDDVVLVGGDEDLRRALEEAQDYGTRVHLWGVEAAAPEYNQSQSLIAEADRRWVIPAEWIQRFVRLRSPEADHPARPALDPVPHQDAGHIESAASSRPVEAQRSGPATSSEDLARLVARFDKDTPPVFDSPARGWKVTEAGADDIPRLRDITTAAQAWRDNEEDATIPGRTPADLGANFGGRWVARATTDQMNALMSLRPRAPRQLDGELLRYAERLGVDTWEDEIAKNAVRCAFWDAIAGGAPGNS